MQNEDEIAVARRFYEEFLNRRDPAVADEILAADFLDHGAPPDAPRGIVGAKQFVAWLANVFPDGRVTVEDMVAERGKVAIRLTATGTQNGPIMGFPATDKRADWTGIDIIHIANGKITERWGERDIFGMFVQLGLISLPE